MTASSTGPGLPSTRSVSGPGVGELTGANPVDRGKPGSKYHLLIDAGGIPLAVGLSADKGYDFPGCRRALRRRGISPRIARRGVESSQRLGRHRWKVERSLAWLLANRRLTIRYERRADILTAFLHLACALICARKLQSP
jgi:transposase